MAGSFPTWAFMSGAAQPAGPNGATPFAPAGVDAFATAGDVVGAAGRHAWTVCLHEAFSAAVPLL